MTRRQLVLVATLVATLAASWWASTIDEDVRDTATVPSARAPRAASRGAQPDRAPARESVPLIARTQWPPAAARLMEPPTVQTAAQAPASQPSLEPPPLPFIFVGAIEDDGKRTAILMEGEQVHLVVARQRIDERYRVERVMATQIVFTYLPLQRKQVLDIAGNSGHGG